MDVSYVSVKLETHEYFDLKSPMFEGRLFIRINTINAANEKYGPRIGLNVLPKKTQKASSHGKRGPASPVIRETWTQTPGRGRLTAAVRVASVGETRDNQCC